MKILRSVFDFYINSSIHVALAVTSLAAVTVLEYGFVPEPIVLLFIFFGAVTGYNFVKYAGISNRHNLEITSNLYLIYGFSVLCVFGALYFGSLLPADVLFTAGILGVVTLLYAVPVFSGRNLRSLSGAKIFIIALVWMGVCVWLPLKYHNLNFNLKIFLQSLEIFLFVVALTLPFEIRDLKYDENGLGTLPQLLGARKTKWLGTVFLMIAAVIASFQNYMNDLDFPVALFILILTLIFVWGAKEDQGKYYASFWVEGVPILWLIFLLKI